MEDTKKIEEENKLAGREHCDICKRLHRVNDPCPMRIARAVVTKGTQELEVLTEADRKWLSTNKFVDVLDIMEENIANRMEND